jgi:hypothetical protein
MDKDLPSPMTSARFHLQKASSREAADKMRQAIGKLPKDGIIILVIGGREMPFGPSREILACHAAAGGAIGRIKGGGRGGVSRAAASVQHSATHFIKGELRQINFVAAQRSFLTSLSETTTPAIWNSAAVFGCRGGRFCARSGI